jgi:hypothetical protein
MQLGSRSQAIVAVTEYIDREKTHRGRHVACMIYACKQAPSNEQRHQTMAAAMVIVDTAVTVEAPKSCMTNAGSTI